MCDQKCFFPFLFYLVTQKWEHIRESYCMGFSGALVLDNTNTFKCCRPPPALHYSPCSSCITRSCDTKAVLLGTLTLWYSDPCACWPLTVSHVNSESTRMSIMTTAWIHYCTADTWIVLVAHKGDFCTVWLHYPVFQIHPGSYGAVPDPFAPLLPASLYHFYLNLNTLCYRPVFVNSQM